VLADHLALGSVLRSCERDDARARPFEVERDGEARRPCADDADVRLEPVAVGEAPCVYENGSLRSVSLSP
jgi:hypothetical protein